MVLGAKGFEGTEDVGAMSNGAVVAGAGTDDAGI